MNGIIKHSHFCRFLCSCYSIIVIMAKVVMVTVHNWKLEWKSAMECICKNGPIWKCKIRLKSEKEQWKCRISHECPVRHCSDFSHAGINLKTTLCHIVIFVRQYNEPQINKLPNQQAITSPSIISNGKLNIFSVVCWIFVVRNDKLN